MINNDHLVENIRENPEQVLEVLQKQARYSLNAEQKAIVIESISEFPTNRVITLSKLQTIWSKSSPLEEFARNIFNYLLPD